MLLSALVAATVLHAAPAPTVHTLDGATVPFEQYTGQVSFSLQKAGL